MTTLEELVVRTDAGTFRDSFLDHEALTAQLQAWAKAFPELTSLSSLGVTEEGRDIWLLEVGRQDLDPGRPAVWVDGNMHAAELSGSAVSLVVAEDVLRLHLDPAADVHGLPSHVKEVLREVRFLVVPRISPDGAEAVLKTGRYVRSVPRDTRPNSRRPRWIPEDLDGDGLCLVMRVRDPSGEYVESKEIAGLLVSRELEDEGPYYKLYPEGVIADYDGSTIPDPVFLGDNEPDLNRNFPYRWAPEPAQMGAGRFPLSELESRALVEKTTETPSLFLWMNLHTFGGVHIRPLGTAPDVKMNPADLAVWRQFEAWADELTGYPTVSGFEQFTYEPEKPLHGDLVDYATHTRGCFAWACEIWDLFEQVGLPEKKRFVERYTQFDREHVEAMARWDAEKNRSRVVRPWVKVEHPQLGEVEVGGLDPRFGLWNPPFEMLDEHARGLSALFLRMAALAPRVRLESEVRQLEGDLREVRITVRNVGYLATHGLAASKELPWNEPLHARVEAQGCELVDGSSAVRPVGHLQGWGRGRWSGAGALYYQRSAGSVSAKQLTWIVRGEGALKVTVESCRVGKTALTIEI